MRLECQLFLLYLTPCVLVVIMLSGLLYYEYIIVGDNISSLEEYMYSIKTTSLNTRLDIISLTLNIHYQYISLQLLLAARFQQRVLQGLVSIDTTGYVPSTVNYLQYESNNISIQQASIYGFDYWYKGKTCTTTSQLTSSQLSELYLENIALFISRAISQNQKSQIPYINTAYSSYDFESNILHIIPPFNNADYQMNQADCLINGNSLSCRDQYINTQTSGTLWHSSPSELDDKDRYNITEMCSPIYKTDISTGISSTLAVLCSQIDLKRIIDSFTFEDTSEIQIAIIDPSSKLLLYGTSDKSGSTHRATTFFKYISSLSGTPFSDTEISNILKISSATCGSFLQSNPDSQFWSQNSYLDLNPNTSDISSDQIQLRPIQFRYFSSLSDSLSQQHNMNYTLFNVISILRQDYINEDSKNIRSSVNIIILLTYLICGVVLLIIAIFMLIRGILIVYMIKTPLERLTTVMQSFNTDLCNQTSKSALREGNNNNNSTNALKTEVEFLHQRFANSLEMRILFATVTQVFQTIQFANEAYFSGDSASSLMHWAEAALLFQKTDSKRALGTSLKNIGNIHLKERRFDEAIEYLRQSVQTMDQEIQIEQDRLAQFDETGTMRITHQFTQQHHQDTHTLPISCQSLSTSNSQLFECYEIKHQRVMSLLHAMQKKLIHDKEMSPEQRAKLSELVDSVSQLSDDALPSLLSDHCRDTLAALRIASCYCSLKLPDKAKHYIDQADMALALYKAASIQPSTQYPLDFKQPQPQTINDFLSSKVLLPGNYLRNYKGSSQQQFQVVPQQRVKRQKSKNEEKQTKMNKNNQKRLFLNSSKKQKSQSFYESSFENHFTKQSAMSLRSNRKNSSEGGLEAVRVRKTQSISHGYTHTQQQILNNLNNNHGSNNNVTTVPAHPLHNNKRLLTINEKSEPYIINPTKMIISSPPSAKSCFVGLAEEEPSQGGYNNWEYCNLKQFNPGKPFIPVSNHPIVNSLTGDYDTPLEVSLEINSEIDSRYYQQQQEDMEQEQQQLQQQQQQAQQQGSSQSASAIISGSIGFRDPPVLLKFNQKRIRQSQSQNNLITSNGIIYNDKTITDSDQNYNNNTNNNYNINSSNSHTILQSQSNIPSSQNNSCNSYSNTPLSLLVLPLKRHSIFSQNHQQNNSTETPLPLSLCPSGLELSRKTSFGVGIPSAYIKHNSGFPSQQQQHYFIPHNHQHSTFNNSKYQQNNNNNNNILPQQQQVNSIPQLFPSDSSSPTRKSKGYITPFNHNISNLSQQQQQQKSPRRQSIQMQLLQQQYFYAASASKINIQSECDFTTDPLFDRDESLNKYNSNYLTNNGTIIDDGISNIYGSSLPSIPDIIGIKQQHFKDHHNNLHRQHNLSSESSPCLDEEKAGRSLMIRQAAGDLSDFEDNDEEFEDDYDNNNTMENNNNNNNNNMNNTTTTKNYNNQIGNINNQNDGKTYSSMLESDTIMDSKDLFKGGRQIHLLKNKKGSNKDLDELECEGIVQLQLTRGVSEEQGRRMRQQTNHSSNRQNQQQSRLSQVTTTLSNRPKINTMLQSTMLNLSTCFNTHQQQQQPVQQSLQNSHGLSIEIIEQKALLRKARYCALLEEKYQSVAYLTSIFEDYQRYFLQDRKEALDLLCQLLPNNTVAKELVEKFNDIPWNISFIITPLSYSTVNVALSLIATLRETVEQQSLPSSLSRNKTSIYVVSDEDCSEQLSFQADQTAHSFQGPLAPMLEENIFKKEKISGMFQSQLFQQIAGSYGTPQSGQVFGTHSKEKESSVHKQQVIETLSKKNEFVKSIIWMLSHQNFSSRGSSNQSTFQSAIAAVLNDLNDQRFVNLFIALWKGVTQFQCYFRKNHDEKRKKISENVVIVLINAEDGQRLFDTLFILYRLKKLVVSLTVKFQICLISSQDSNGSIKSLMNQANHYLHRMHMKDNIFITDSPQILLKQIQQIREPIKNLGFTISIEKI